MNRESLKCTMAAAAARAECSNPGGDYFKMFPIPGTRIDSKALLALTHFMSDHYLRRGVNSMPAGYTYFGQFIAHDVSNMLGGEDVPSLEPLDPASRIQQRTASLDLDSLYGNGLNDTRACYDTDGRFISDSMINGRIFDLPRPAGSWATVSKLARIPEPRNDENFIVAQMHVLFMNLHNRIMDFFDAVPGTAAARFEQASHVTRLIYQQLIVCDFLPRVLDPVAYEYYFGAPYTSALPAVLQSLPGEAPRMPLEFSGAAFRFGHSLIQSTYSLNRENLGISMGELFRLTGKGGREITPDLAIDWKHFFAAGVSVFNRASSIEPQVVPDLKDMRNEAVCNRNLYIRNMRRNQELDLPCGQDIVRYLQRSGHPGAAWVADGPAWMKDFFTRLRARGDATAYGLDDDFLGVTAKTPLWLYVLIEPSYIGQHKFNRLGPLGSLIVAETLRMLIAGTSSSIFHPFSAAAARHPALRSKIAEIFSILGGPPLPHCSLPSVSFAAMLDFLTSTQKEPLHG